MTNVVITNPNRIIAAVDIAADTDTVVVLLVDLQGNGKHAEIEMIQGNTLFFGDMETSITVNHPFGNDFYFAYQTNRYTCTITVLNGADSVRMKRRTAYESTT